MDIIKNILFLFLLISFMPKSNELRDLRIVEENGERFNDTYIDNNVNKDSDLL